MRECQSRLVKRHSTLWRLMVFVAALAAGIVAGLLGYHFTGQQGWFLAIPGVVALVWLFVANPGECCTKSPGSQGEQRKR